MADIMRRLDLCPLREGTVLRSPIHGFSINDADISSGADDTSIFKFNECLLVATSLIAETSCDINEDFNEALYLSCRQKIGSTEMIFALLTTKKNLSEETQGWKEKIRQPLLDLQKQIYARVRALRAEVAEIAGISSAAAPTDTENKIKLKICSIRALRLGGEMADIMRRLDLCPLREGTVLRSPIHGFSIDDADISSGADDTSIFKFNECLLVATSLIAETSCDINEDFNEALYLSCRQKIGSTEMIFALLTTKKNLSEETQGWKEKIRQPLLDLQKQIYARVRALRAEVAEIARISSAAAPTDTENKIKLKICSIRSLLRLGGEMADIMRRLDLCPLREGTVLRSPIHGFSIDDV
ncbi:hypothetical protein VPH35_060515 [Triticum aestivum]|nr:uncharacterized protein LOC123078957 isoform X1 [Triticum aestivum]